MPRRPIIPYVEPKKTKAQEEKELKKNLKRNEKRREARKWRARADVVGIERPKKGRQTPSQRKVWQEKIIKREKALNIKAF